MVITTTIANWRVKRVLIDQGSSTDVLFWLVFKKIEVPNSHIQSYMDLLLKFAVE